MLALGISDGVCGEQGYHCDLDNSSKTLQKKIRDNQLAQYNYILVVGKEEVENKTVNVRTRDNQVRWIGPLAWRPAKPRAWCRGGRGTQHAQRSSRCRRRRAAGKAGRIAAVCSRAHAPLWRARRCMGPSRSRRSSRSSRRLRRTSSDVRAVALRQCHVSRPESLHELDIPFFTCVLAPREPTQRARPAAMAAMTGRSRCIACGDRSTTQYKTRRVYQQSLIQLLMLCLHLPSTPGVLVQASLGTRCDEWPMAEGSAGIHLSTITPKQHSLP